MKHNLRFWKQIKNESIDHIVKSVTHWPNYEEGMISGIQISGTQENIKKINCWNINKGKIK